MTEENGRIRDQRERQAHEFKQAQAQSNANIRLDWEKKVNLNLFRKLPGLDRVQFSIHIELPVTHNLTVNILLFQSHTTCLSTFCPGTNTSPLSVR